MRCFICIYFIFAQFYVGFCNFLELTDLSMVDSLPYVWSNRVTQLQETKCTIQTTEGSATEGICISRPKCLMSGGVANGRCGLLSVCCTYGRTRSTNAKVSYFSSNDVSLTESPITYNVMVLHKNICQLRLDFLEFDIAAATPNAALVYECLTDLFYIMPAPTSMPQICGYNTGQHMYVHIPTEIRNISLNVKFTDRTGDGPRWNIKVTQLQCPGVPDKKVLIDKTSAEDYSLLAPYGCLQYFTKQTGTIKNFGYKVELLNNNVYVGNQYYAICFKKTSRICGIQFTVTFINLSTPCNDYFIMPGTTLIENNQVCPSVLGTDFIFYVRSPGPLNILFYAGATDGLGGFSFDYVLELCTQ